MSLLQDQLKFVYDTLEDCVKCGHTYFPAREITKRLKDKSNRPTGSKQNEYEREYAVRLIRSLAAAGDSTTCHQSSERQATLPPVCSKQNLLTPCFIFI